MQQSTSHSTKQWPSTGWSAIDIQRSKRHEKYWVKCPDHDIMSAKYIFTKVEQTKAGSNWAL